MFNFAIIFYKGLFQHPVLASNIQRLIFPKCYQLKIEALYPRIPKRLLVILLAGNPSPI